MALLVRSRLGIFQNDDLRLWSTLFVSICLQALPFLALGVVISGAIAAFVSPDFVKRIVPRRHCSPSRLRVWPVWRSLVANAVPSRSPAA